MSSDLTCFINISPSDGFLFTNSCNNDMLIYTETPEQNILIGTHSNIPAILHISSNQTSVYGNIVPFSNGTFSLGTPSLRFKDLFLTGATLDIGGVQLSLDQSSNSLAVKSSDGEYTRIIAQELQLGTDSNAVVVKIDPSNSTVQFLNVASSNGIVSSNISSLSQWSNQGPALFTENVLLGINTSNPQYEFDVTGDINLTGDLFVNSKPFLESRNIYATSSNIGIGLSNPESGFATSYDATFKSNVTIFGILTVSNIQYVTSNVTILDSQIVNSNITTLNTLTFSNQTGAIFLDSSNGNLGINTSNPNHTLDVNGDINFNGTLKQNGKNYVGSQWSNIDNSVCILDSNVAIGTSNAESGFVSAVTSTFRSNVAFLDSLSLKSASIHSINSNIGINTSNPNYTLDVNGDINFTGTLKQNGSPYIGSQWSNESSNVFLFASNVGIGKSNPVYQLDVIGDLNFTGHLLKNGMPYALSVDASDSEVISQSNINILKNDKNSLLLAKWAGIVDGAAQDTGYAVTSDDFGNVYLTGDFTNYNTPIYNFDGSTTISLSNSTNTSAAFLVKYSSNGNAQWAASIDGTNSESIYSVTADGNENVYITGYYNTLINIYNAGHQHSGFALSNNYLSSYVVKYNAGGIAQWALHLKGSNSVYANAVKVDKYDNIFVTGLYTTNSLPIYNADGSPSPITLRATSGSDSVYCIKYDSNGNALFAMTVDGTSYETGNNIAIDLEDNIYIAGNYSSTNAIVYSSDNTSNITLPPRTGFGSGYVVKFNSNGIAEWATAVDKGTGIGVQVDADKNVYLCGNRFEGLSTIYNAGGVSSGATFGTPAALAGYVVKWDSNGNYQYRIGIEGPQANAINSIHVNTHGELFVGGNYRTGCVIYENNSPSLLSFPSPGGVAAYVVRFDTQGKAKSKIIIDGSQYDSTNWIHIDANNNLYIAGAYYQIVPTITNEDNLPSSVNLSLPGGQAAFLIKCEPKYLPSTYYLSSSNYENVQKYIVNSSTTTSAIVKVQNETNTSTLYQFEVQPKQSQGLIYDKNAWYYISAPSTNIVNQWSNMSSNVFILSSNIGINTSNPNYTLDVNGDISFNGSLIQNGAPYIGSQWTTESSNVYIIDSNIGIGLSNPTSSLTVAGDVEFRSNIFLKNNTFIFRGLKVLKPASNASVTNVTTTVDSVPGYNFQNNIITLTGQQANFIINGSNILTLSNENVGIKNSNPSYSLDVVGDSRLNGTLFMSNLVIGMSNNNLGIGTSNPTFKLEVNGSMYSSKISINTSPIFTNFDINLPLTGKIGNTGTDRAYFEMSNSGYDWLINARNIVFRTSNQGTLNNERFRINDVGNVGISVSNPSYRLHVSGDIYATANVLAYSDSNYKDNIQVIPNALDKLENITGYTFSFKEDPTAKRYAGLLAQEVQNVLPEVVSRDSNQQLSLAYGNTVALLVNAIKELRSEVKSLKENMSNTN